jgi:hypothetical protein
MLPTLGGPWMAGLILPAFCTLGSWIAAYLLLSLSMALVWIALVSIGRLYQRNRRWPTRLTRPRLARLTVNFHRWHHENGPFSRQLALLQDTLASSSSSDPATSAYDLKRR